MSDTLVKMKCGDNTGGEYHVFDKDSEVCRCGKRTRETYKQNSDVQNIFDKAVEKYLDKFVSEFIKLLKSFPEGELYTVNPIILELKVFLDKYKEENKCQ
jgi:hypothetical protein